MDHQSPHHGSLKAVKVPTLKSSSSHRRTLPSAAFSSSICCYSDAASCNLGSGDRFVSGSKGRLKTTLRTIFREEVRSEGDGIRRTREGELAEWQKLQRADQKLPICQSKQLPLQQRQRPTIGGLIIDNLRLCCFLTPLPSLFLSLFSCSSFLSRRLDTGLRHESRRPVFGSVTSHFCCRCHAARPITPPPHPRPSVAMAPARSPRGPSYLHSSACSTPDVDTIQPSVASQKSGSATPRC